MGQSAITGINLGVPAYQANFTNGDLVAGVLTVNHGLNSQYVSVTVYNNSNLIIIPDDVTASSTTQCTIDLTSYGTLTGTWRAVIIDKGATNSYSAPVVPRFKAYNSGNISLTDRTFQTYVPDIEIFDEGGYFDLGGTSRYTPLVAGVYFFYFFWATTGNSLSKTCYARIEKNGVAWGGSISSNEFGVTASSNMSTIITSLIELNGSTDYVTFHLRADHIGGTTNQSAGNGPASTQCGGYLVS